MKGLHGRAGTQMQVVASWYQGWGPEARQRFLSTLVQVASGAGEGDLEAALSSLSLEGADEMLPCQIRLFKGWWREWGHDNRSNFISNFCKVTKWILKKVRMQTNFLFSTIQEQKSCYGKVEYWPERLTNTKRLDLMA